MMIQGKKSLFCALLTGFVAPTAFSQPDIPSSDEVENTAEEAQEELNGAEQDAEDNAEDVQNSVQEDLDDKQQELGDGVDEAIQKRDELNDTKEKIKGKVDKKTQEEEETTTTPEEYHQATPKRLRNNVHLEMHLGLGIGVAKDVKNTQFETDFANYAVSGGFAFKPFQLTFLPGPIKPFAELAYQSITGVYTIESPDIKGAKESSGIIHYLMAGGGLRTFLPKLPKLILSANAKLGLTWVTTARFGQNDTHAENEREVQKIGAAFALNFNVGYKVWDKIQVIGGMNTNIGTHSLYTFTAGVRSLF